jgi:hypothetical protein
MLTPQHLYSGLALRKAAPLRASLHRTRFPFARFAPTSRTFLLAALCAVCALTATFTPTSAAAQPDALKGLHAGLRLGPATGLTVRKSVGTDSEWLEAIATVRAEALTLTGLYEFHRYNSFNFQGLSWFYGGGGHATLFPVGDEDGPIAIGLDGIVGLEYVIPDVPLSVSLDWKPAFNILGPVGLVGDEGALSVRYHF